MSTKAYEQPKQTARETSHQKLVYLTTTALFAALICVTTAYFLHIPFGLNGGYIHVGDALIYLAASLLPLPYAMAAGAIGGVFADLLTAPVWAPATFFIKMLIALPFTGKKDHIINKRNVAGVFIAAVITCGGYYLAEVLLFGAKAALIASLTTNVIQSVGSAILYLLLGLALDRMGFKRIVQSRLGN